MRAIENLLIENKLEPDPIALFDFIQSAIELRELANFISRKIYQMHY